MNRKLAMALVAIAVVLLSCLLIIVTVILVRELVKKADEALPTEAELIASQQAILAQWELPLMPGVWPMPAGGPSRSGFADCEIGLQTYLKKTKRVFTQGKFGPSFVSAVTSDDGRIVLFDGGGLDILLPNGHSQYSAAKGGPYNLIMMPSPVIMHDGTIVYHAWDNKLTAVQHEHENSSLIAETQWQYQLTLEQKSFSPLVSSGGFTFDLSMEPSAILAIDSSGLLAWKYAFPSDTYIHSQLLSTDENGEIYCLISQQHVDYLCAIDSTGNLKWQAETGYRAILSYAVTNGDGKIFVSTNDGYLLAFTNDGVKLWEEQIVANILEPETEYDLSPNEVQPPLIDAEGRLYVFTAQGDVVSLDPEGNELWRAKQADGIRAPGFVSANGLVVCQTVTGDLLALYADDGRQAWRIKLATEPGYWSSPLSANANGDVLVFGPRGSLHIVATQPAENQSQRDTTR